MDFTAEPTLSLDDFVLTEKISNKSEACPSNNVGLVAALKKFQTSMHILFSDAFEACLDAFIDNLEGVLRPMELVAADFLRYSIETVLRKFFRTVRSVKGTALTDQSLRTPEQCANFLRELFDTLSADLSEHHAMKKLEAYYRFRLARRTSAPSVNTITPPKSNITAAKVDKIQHVKFASAVERKTPSEKICSGNLGGQLGAVKKDGSAYGCTFGKDCGFRHMSIAGKSAEKLAEAVASMPAVAQVDLRKALQGNK